MAPVKIDFFILLHLCKNIWTKKCCVICIDSTESRTVLALAYGVRLFFGRESKCQIASIEKP